MLTGKKNGQENPEEMPNVKLTNRGERERKQAWMGEVSIFCQLRVYKYYSIKVVSLPPVRKPQRYHHLMTRPWERGHGYQMSK